MRWLLPLVGLLLLLPAVGAGHGYVIAPKTMTVECIAGSALFGARIAVNCNVGDGAATTASGGVYRLAVSWTPSLGWDQVRADIVTCSVAACSPGTVVCVNNSCSGGTGTIAANFGIGGPGLTVDVTDAGAEVGISLSIQPYPLGLPATAKQLTYSVAHV